MSTSDQAVLSFLTAVDAIDARRSKVAMELAESMVRELKLALAEWEETVNRLRSEDSQGMN